MKQTIKQQQREMWLIKVLQILGEVGTQESQQKQGKVQKNRAHKKACVIQMESWDDVGEIVA
jgi:hypothetical protein